LDLVYQFLFVIAAATVVVSLLLFGAAFRAAQRGAEGELARAARWCACFTFAAAVFGAFWIRRTTTDWMHFQWSLGPALLSAFWISGAFLPSTWPDDRTRRRAWDTRSTDWTRSGWWFPAAALALASASVTLQLLEPGRVPAERNSPGPLVGTFELAAYGLGLGELPSLLQVRFPHDAQRGMDHLTRDLTVPLSVLTLAAEMLCAYVTLALGLRFVRNASVRLALGFVSPIAVSVIVFARWRGLSYGLWHETPFEIRAFGPTLAAAAFALALLAAAWLRDRSRARGSEDTRSDGVEELARG
jgi:hypothetical protein